MLSVVGHMLLVIGVALNIGIKAQSDEILNVTVTADPPVDTTLCEDDIITLTCQVSEVTQPLYKWSSSNFDITDQTKSIIILAATFKIQYYCMVFDAATNRSGEGSIVIANSNVSPVLHKANFESVVEVEEGGSLNLTVEVFNNMSLKFTDIIWSRLDDDPLPENAIVIDFVVNGINYTSLELFNLSFANDSGNYSLTAINECGSSDLSVYVNVRGPKVCPSIDPAPLLLKGCVDSVAVDKDIITYSCSFEANYTKFITLTENYWKIKILNHSTIRVDDTSTYDKYSIAVYRDCVLNNETCCRVTSEISINATSEVDNATVTCYAGIPILKNYTTNSSAHLTVLMQPRLITSPINVNAKEKETAYFQCDFTASTLKYLTITEWYKDSIKLNNNTNKFQITEKLHKINEVRLTLNISNISRNDKGRYRCHCYYNTTFLHRFGIYEKYSSQGFAMLEIEEASNNSDNIGLVIGLSLPVVAIIVVGILILLYYKKKTQGHIDKSEKEALMSKDHDDHDEDNDDYGTTTNTRSLTETDFSAVGEHTDAGDEHTDAVDGHIESDTVDEHNNTGGGCTNILKESATLTTVPFVPALSPPTTNEDLIGKIEYSVFDARGGAFHSNSHGATIIVPEGAISAGKLAELKFAATMVAPVKFPHNKIPVSAIFWICMDVSLEKPIQLRLPHASNNFTGNLQFAKGSHSSLDKGQYTMEILQGGDFSAGNHIGSIKIKHFCYYCIVDDKLNHLDYPHNKYIIGSMKQRDINPKDNIWMDYICILPSLATCIKKFEEQYENDVCNWEYETLADFSCPPGCNRFKIEFGDQDKLINKAEIKINSKENIIDKKDVDFYSCFGDEVALKQLKLRMDQKLYPPRIKLTIRAVDDTLFKSVNLLDVKLLCGSESIFNGSIIIPSYAGYGSVTSASESGTSTTTSSEPTSQRNGKLNLEDLLKKTTPARNRWFEIGLNLDVSINQLEKIEKKHGRNQSQCLAKVYRYWLDERNDLQPTLEKLQKALDDIREYSTASLLMSDKKSEDEPERSLVIKHPRLHLLDLPTLIPVLNKYGLLDTNDNYTLQNPHIPPLERCNALIFRMLPAKGPGAFKKFIACLGEETQHSGHQEWIKVLKSEFVFEEKRLNKISSLQK